VLFSFFFSNELHSSGPPPPPPPRDSLVYDSPLEEAARSSKRVSVNKGKVSYDGHDKSDRFDERGSDRFDEPEHVPPPPIPFEPVRVSQLQSFLVCLKFDACPKEPVLDIDVRCTICRKEIEGEAQKNQTIYLRKSEIESNRRRSAGPGRPVSFLVLCVPRLRQQSRHRRIL
jgi:hypothetical protein